VFSASISRILKY